MVHLDPVNDPGGESIAKGDCSLAILTEDDEIPVSRLDFWHGDHLSLWRCEAGRPHCCGIAARPVPKIRARPRPQWTGFGGDEMADFGGSGQMIAIDRFLQDTIGIRDTLVLTHMLEP